ncbi:MAG: hypothetical protein H0U18_12625 [Pyrinomonadaceae bacterium]|nr:hypothetical protein [Pyrinomonadaceae bacterium]
MGARVVEPAGAVGAVQFRSRSESKKVSARRYGYAARCEAVAMPAVS